jgi:hypothetical protein
MPVALLDLDQISGVCGATFIGQSAHYDSGKAYCKGGNRHNPSLPLHGLLLHR